MVIEGKWAPLSRHISLDSDPMNFSWISPHSGGVSSGHRAARNRSGPSEGLFRDGRPPWIYEKYMDKFNIYGGISTHVLKYMENVWKIYRYFENIWLVVDLPLWKIWKSMGRIIPYIMGKSSKPPTKYMVYMGKSYLHTHKYIHVIYIYII